MNNKVPCPFCGEEIDANAASCKYCGSDEDTGWSESAYSDSMGVDEGFDYDELLEKEFGGKPSFSVKNKKAILFKIASILLLLIFIFFIILQLM